MNSRERKEKIIKILAESNEPVSGSQLSKLLGVSRQVIVQDMALIRASGVEILSTYKGYYMNRNTNTKVRRTFVVKHDNETMEEELLIIVDHGGKILDVVVTHEIYGNISTELLISNRSDVFEFIEKVKSNNIVPLKELTNGIHSHTVEAESNKILNKIESLLKDKNFLIIS